MDIEKKREEIRKNCNEESIFSNPIENLFYTDDELRQLVQEFESDIDLSKYGPVQRSHRVKALFIEFIGYPQPKKFRGGGRSFKPKFRGQLMDIFAQSSTNLQVWNYLPYSLERLEDLPEPWTKFTYADCRYVIIPIIDGRVGHCRVVKGSELGILDKTKTRTIKYQATVPREMFKQTGIEIISPFDRAVKIFCGGKLNADELGELLSPLIGESLIQGSDRQIGQDFHKKVSNVLGIHSEKIDDGQFPDLPEYQTEIKFQMSPTIDLGMILPATTEEINRGIIPAQTTYILGIGYLDKGTPIVNYIIAVLGQDFQDRFKLWNSINSKVQIPIPANWLE